MVCNSIQDLRRNIVVREDDCVFLLLELLDAFDHRQKGFAPLLGELAARIPNANVLQFIVKLFDGQHKKS